MKQNVKCQVNLFEGKDPGSYVTANDLLQALVLVPSDAIIRADEFGRGLMAEWSETRGED